MRLALVVPFLGPLLATSAAHAEVPVRVAPMTAASDDICKLLESDRHDHCKRVVHAGDATAYQSGSAELRRFVLAIARPADDAVIGASVDLYGDARATLVSTHPSVRAVRLDGRPAVLLDVTATFRADRDTWQTESVVGCGQAADGAWRCSTAELGTCGATIDDDGAITTACGDHTRLTLAR